MDDLILYNTNLTNANLSNTFIFEAKFINANITKASFSSRILFSVDFTNADLTNADLRGSIVIDVDLTNANLTNSDLSGIESLAHDSDLDFSGANLTNANLVDANLTDVRIKENIILPESFSLTEMKYASKVDSINKEQVNEPSFTSTKSSNKIIYSSDGKPVKSQELDKSGNT